MRLIDKVRCLRTNTSLQGWPCSLVFVLNSPSAIRNELLFLALSNFGLSVTLVAIEGSCSSMANMIRVSRRTLLLQSQTDPYLDKSLKSDRLTCRILKCSARSLNKNAPLARKCPIWLRTGSRLRGEASNFGNYATPTPTEPVKKLRLSAGLLVGLASVKVTIWCFGTFSIILR